MNNIRIIAFDADDTLWVNQPYFDEIEEEYCNLLQPYMSQKQVSEQLLKIEIENMRLYGFGIKAFTLSMIEAAISISENKIDTQLITKIISLGKELLNKPIEIIPGVEEVLESLQSKYQVVLATKGDLLDQESKLKRSGLEQYFRHTEVMSDKQVYNYQKFISYLDCAPNEFLMIGNSFKSDILPVLEIGGNAAYVPYHKTWELEKIEDNREYPNLIRIRKITDILTYLS